MSDSATPFDLNRLNVQSLTRRKNFTFIDEILVDPDASPAPLPEPSMRLVELAAEQIRAAQNANASVMLIYGAHLIKNGAATLVGKLIEDGWLTHLATNGAGTIHDWESAFQGETSESVKHNVANGTFGVWDETATNIHVAILAGALDGLGYGQSLGRFICEDGTTLPSIDELREQIAASPADPFTSARADLLQKLQQRNLPSGKWHVEHPWRHASALAYAYQHGVPATVHPGVGYDIISNHPIFCGAAIGRAAETDFKLFAGSVEKLEGGVVLNVGSAIMGPQVFEKSMSCVNNVRLQQGLPAMAGHNIYVVDIQDGGNWDWSTGEPPQNHPAYYLRFCKSYSRMGGTMHYAQCDNVQFMHHLWQALRT